MVRTYVVGEQGQRRGGVAGDSFAYFAATVGSLAVGLISGVVTARTLGPSDRGDYSVVVLLVGLAGLLSGLGLADAAVYHVRSTGRRLQDVAGGTLTVVLVATGVACVAVAVAVRVLLPDAETGLLLAAAAAVASAAVAALLSTLLLAVGGSRAASFGFLLVSTATTVAVVVLLVVRPGGVRSAVAAGAVGSSVGVAWLFLALRQRGVLVLPRSVDRPYLRGALRYGLPVQLGALLTAVAARVDLLVVFTLLGSAAAGQYSVALTMASVATAPASAVSWGAFPQLAASAENDVVLLVRRCLRAGLTVTLLVAPVLLGGSLLIPAVYGAEYEPAAVPGVLLAISGLLTGLQYLTARLAAARGRPRALPLSSLAFLGVMLGGDLLLVPAWGLVGAAVAAVAGALVGLGVAGRELECVVPGALSRTILPRPGDLLELLRLPRTMLGRGQRQA